VRNWVSSDEELDKPIAQDYEVDTPQFSAGKSHHLPAFVTIVSRSLLTLLA